MQAIICKKYGSSNGRATKAGTLRPVIDCCYPMENIVEAHRYVDQGHKKGNVAISITQHTNLGGAG